MKKIPQITLVFQSKFEHLIHIQRAYAFDRD